jgi:uncharacterized protein (TIGR00269 family)
VAKCKICGKPGFIYVAEYKGYLCREHYSRFIESKVDRCIKRHSLLKGVRRLLIGISGGKDSIVLAYILKKLYGHNIEMEGLHIDLGIPDYSNESAKTVDKLASLIGLEVTYINLEKEYGFSIREAADYYFRGKLNRPPCSVCGTVKRYILNRYSIENGFDAIATGHNLDDITRFASMDIVTGQVLELTKQVPREESIHPKLVTRIRPLCFISDAETRRYVEANELPVVEASCPYKPPERKLSQILSTKIEEIEKAVPGFKLMYINNLWSKLIPSIKKQTNMLNECEICGMPTSGRVCSFCRIRRILSETRG